MTSPAVLSAEDCAAMLGGLSAEKLARFEIYLALLKKWQKAINLVGPKTLADPWRRHILDSGQLIRWLPDDGNITDLGSGAGLPGIILAILTAWPVTLVESDQRKATFLREAARETASSNVTVETARAEKMEPNNTHVVTARALAPLPRLLPLVHRHLAEGGTALLLKGADVDEELTLAAKNWKMDISRERSLSDAAGTILVLRNLAPKNVG